VNPGQLRLGHSEVHVTPLMFGGAPIGGLFAPVSEAGARATLEAAWAAGIRAFDTAPHYGAGLSEQRLGAFLRGLPRAEFTVCTKVGRRLMPAGDGADDAEGFYGAPPVRRVRDYSRDGVLASLEDSLARLGLDRVDIVLIHDPDEHLTQALDEAFPALAGLRAAGVVGAVGVGMNEAGLAEWFVRRADLDCVLVAGRYTLLDTSAARTLFPECLRRGVAVLAGGVFNSGVLAKPEPDATYDYAAVDRRILARARRIAAICARHGLPLPAAALRFSLAHPAVTAVVVGARSPAEITQDAGYLAGGLPDGLLGELVEAGLLSQETLTDATPTDATLPSGAHPEGTLPRGAWPEGTLPGGATPDASLPGGATPDASLPGGATPDASLPGGELPEGTPP
jgi:D-threo-aldose 1-dehydrogenase